MPRRAPPRVGSHLEVPRCPASSVPSPAARRFNAACWLERLPSAFCGWLRPPRPRRSPSPTSRTGVGAGGVAVTPDAKSAYVPNADGTVSQYDIDPSSGVLEPKNPATVAAGVGALSVVVTPDGRSAYVKNQGGLVGSVSEYDIDPSSGVLTPKTPATIAT